MLADCPIRVWIPMMLSRRSSLDLPMRVLVAVGLAAVSFLAVAGEPPPHETVVLESAALGEQRCINVYVPPVQADDRRLPVIYMPDGGVDEDFPHVAHAIDAAIREGRMAPVLLVGIENTQRRRDLTGPTAVDEDRTIAPVVGGSAAFRAFIASELVPWVEADFAVTAQRAIIGESLAGLFILETLFEAPALFDTWVALDPSLWWNDGRLAQDAADWLGAHPGLVGRLYIAWTEPETIGPNVKVLEEALGRAAPPGLAWQVIARPELDHSNIYRTVAPEVLPVLYPPGSGQGGVGDSGGGASLPGE
jgi:predicted alpha/beta superfamily hydrolase